MHIFSYVFYNRILRKFNFFPNIFKMHETTTNRQIHSSIFASRSYLFRTFLTIYISNWSCIFQMYVFDVNNLRVFCRGELVVVIIENNRIKETSLKSCLENLWQFRTKRASLSVLIWKKKHRSFLKIPLDLRMRIFLLEIHAIH